jgi:AraC-like DNA-binding protein
MAEKIGQPEIEYYMGFVGGLQSNHQNHLNHSLILTPFMLSSNILLITAALGFLCTAFIFGEHKNQAHSLINKYLIIITTTNAVKFLFHGISHAYPEIEISKLVTMMDVSIIMLMPCYFLYFQDIVYENKFKMGNLLHFIVPFLLGAVYITILFASPDKTVFFKKLFFFVGILFYLIYATIVFVMLYKYVWTRKTDIKAIQKQNELIKNWSIFLYFSFFVIVLVRVITSIVSDEPGSFNNNYYWIVGIVWMGIFIKIMLTPKILYGYNFLNKKIDAFTENVVLSSVWLIEGTVSPITSEKDKKIEEKMNSLLIKYIHQIEELSFHTPAFRNPDLTLNDISDALNIPNSHINYIVKYHCNENFVNYKKIVRIHDATKLLEGGYLDNQKVESLAAVVGFSSYNTFIIAFKNITGLTTQEYARRF